MNNFDLQTHFTEQCINFQSLKDRLSFLEKIDIQLKEITKEKKFRINNYFIWYNLQFTKQKLFIDAYEWFNFMSSKNRYTNNSSFLGKVQSVLNLVRFKKAKSFDHDQYYSNYVSTTITNLYGECKNKKHQKKRLCECDISKMIDDANRAAKCIKDARDSCCHPYDNIPIINISLKDIRNAIDLFDNHMLMIISICNYSLTTDPAHRSYQNDDRIIEDIIDQIICGDISHIGYMTQNYLLK